MATGPRHLSIGTFSMWAQSPYRGVWGVPAAGYRAAVCHRCHPLLFRSVPTLGGLSTSLCEGTEAGSGH